MERTDPPVFFVSYAHADAEHPEHRMNLENFVEDLSAEVARTLATPLKGVSFFDPDIQNGEVWSDVLGDALMRCGVGVVLYTRNYFNRTWCGKEFQVFLNRSHPSQSGAGIVRAGIVPIRWARTFPDLPACATKFQHNSGAFPPEYASMGMEQLSRLRSVQPAEYRHALNVLVDCIVEEANARRLKPLRTLDFDAVESAWDANDPQSHTRGNISKTCFVFISRDGWGWEPYEGTPAQIGALAQKISGELGLRYQEIPCDDSLPKKLEEAKNGNVPTVLFADPDSICEETYTRPMQRYDSQYLLNCATLVAWKPEDRAGIEADQRWLYLKKEVLKQKAKEPLPRYHELRSIFSRDDLALKARTLIEEIRSDLMNELISDLNTPARKVTDQALSQSAAGRGIHTASLPHLESQSQ